MEFLDKFIGFVFPNYCAQCGTKLFRNDTNCFCRSCWQKISVFKGPFCLKCGREVITESGVCRECRGRSHYHDELRAVGAYDGILKSAIHLYKFLGRWKMARDFTALILEGTGKEYWEGTDFIVPVPLSRSRLQERGFHQTRLVTEHLSGALGIPPLNSLLIKHRETRPQSLLKKEERMENLKGAFRLHPGLEKRVRGRSIMLFDDVATTGATVRECCRVLKQHGTGRIRVLVLAR